MKVELNEKSGRTRRVVERFYEALAAGDFETIAGLFAEDADWFVPGHERAAPWLGKRSTRREIKEFFETLAANAELQRAEIQQILTDGEFAVATGEFASRMLKTGKIFESVFSAHFTVRDDLIVRYRLLEDSYGLVEALSDECRSEFEGRRKSDAAQEREVAARVQYGFLNKGFFREVFGGAW